MEPNRIQVVIEQIESHPHYYRTNGRFKFTFEIVKRSLNNGGGPLSHHTGGLALDDQKWLRYCWRHMYRKIPMPDGHVPIFDSVK